MDRSHRALGLAVYAMLGTVLYLVSPYLTVLVVAAVTAVLAWPVQQWMTGRLGGRRRVAGLASIILLTVCVIAPAGPLVLIVAREVGNLISEAGAGMHTGSWESLLAQVDASAPGAWLAGWTGNPTLISDTVRSLTVDAARAIGAVITTQVPNLVGLTVRAVLNLVIFYLAVYAMLVRGPHLYEVVRVVSPVEERHLVRLFEVFAQFARNVVLASVAAATSQGAVATLGFSLAGVDRPMLLGVVTMVLSFVPFVGSTLVWLPLALVQVAQGRLGAGLFIALWSMFLTGTVDNFVRPVLVRGRTEVPMVLVFLGVFGGLAWLGIVGVLVGPVLMAMLMALIRIYREEKAAQISPPEVAPGGVTA